MTCAAKTKFSKKSLVLVLATLFPAAAHAADDANPVTLEEVVVTASRPALGTSSLDEANLAPMRPATSDTASLLRDVPGVSLYGAGGVSSLPAMQGLADDRLRIKVDGMDIISACGNHMNPPLSYIDPSNVGSIQVFAGITPVSVGGDSIGGAIQVNSPAPEFAREGEGTLLKGQAGAFYRSNGNAKGSNVSATIASEKLSMTYSGSTVESGNYKAGGDFKPAGLAFTDAAQSYINSTKWLPGDEVGGTMYKSTNQSLGFALRNASHLVELKLGFQDIPYQGFPNQRMDMTGNDSRQINLRYTGQYDWGKLEARAYNEHTRHKMNFLEDKVFWYMNPTGQTIPAPGMPMDTEGRNTGAVVKADIELSAQDILRVGGEYQRYRFNDWWDPSGDGGMSPNTFWNINDGKRDRLAVFGEWEARWSPQWLSLFGVRSETVAMDTGIVQGYNTTQAQYLPESTAFNASDRSRLDRNWDLTVLARYTADSSETYEFGYARKTRSPNLYERYTWSTGGMAMNMINMVGDGNGYVGNLELKPEIANTISATADWHDDEQQDWGLKVTPFYTYVQDYINVQRCSSLNANCGAANQTATTGFVFLKYVNQDAQLYGLDVSGNFPLAKNTGYGSFTATGMLNYVKGKTRSGTEDNLYNMMPLNAKLAVVQRTGSWSNTVEGQFVAAKDTVSQIRDEMQTAGYGLMHLRSSYEWKQARFDVGIENVFDRLYALPLGGAYVGQGLTMPPTGGAPYGITVPGMGRSIYAGVNVKF